MPASLSRPWGIRKVSIYRAEEQHEIIDLEIRTVLPKSGALETKGLRETKSAFRRSREVKSFVRKSLRFLGFAKSGLGAESVVIGSIGGGKGPEIQPSLARGDHPRELSNV